MFEPLKVYCILQRGGGGGVANLKKDLDFGAKIRGVNLSFRENLHEFEISFKNRG